MAMALVDKRGDQRKRKLTMFSRKDGDVSRMFVRFTSPADIRRDGVSGHRRGRRPHAAPLPSGAGQGATHIHGPAKRQLCRNRLLICGHGYERRRRLDQAETARRQNRRKRVATWSRFCPQPRRAIHPGRGGCEQETWLPLRLRFYDKRGEERKRLTIKEVRKESSRWIITESKMVDLKRRHTTVLKVISIKLRDDVPDGTVHRSSPRAKLAIEPSCRGFSARCCRRASIGSLAWLSSQRIHHRQRRSAG